MATYKIPDSPKRYKTEYTKFKGVDLSSNPTQVDSTRGASGTVNLISDSGGFPEKRKGWRVLLNVEKPVNGLYRGIIKGREYFLVHGGTRLYKWTESALTELKSGLTNKQGTSFTLNDKMYVLTGGELAACIIADSVVRIIPGAIGDEASALTDSFQDNLLAPPVYTRPAEFRGWRVPDVLLSGNFAEIAKWQDNEAYERTKRLRPDLLNE